MGVAATFLFVVLPFMGGSEDSEAVASARLRHAVDLSWSSVIADNPAVLSNDLGRPDPETNHYRIDRMDEPATSRTTRQPSLCAA